LIGIMPGSPYPCWRIITLPPSRGSSQMALDQALLEEAKSAAFTPTLRLYEWSPPALSIGRFQPLEDVDLDACSSQGVEVVRRPTGGKSILHLDDFTYSIIMPKGFPLPESVVDAYRLICEGILAALKILGIDAAIQPQAGEAYKHAGGACFSASTQADLEYAGRKLCGSAQVRRGGALLQHGSILLEDRSELLFRLLRFADEVERKRGLEDFRRRCLALSDTGCHCTWPQVAESFREGFSRAFGVNIEDEVLTSREKRRRETLARAYDSEQWLRNAESQAFPR
jgi:lipoyl(octanoyl) transferase